MPKSLAEIRAVIIDMDGVLWRGARTLPGVPELFEFLRANSIGYLLATNNATRTPEYYVERVGRLGVNISPEQVLTSAYATAGWLRKQLPSGSGTFVVGEEGLEVALARSGFTLTAEGAAAVVVGLDRHFDYEKLRKASDLVRSGAQFVATNADRTFPGEDGLLPGAGALVAAVETACSSSPTIIGKPYAPMFEMALAILQTPRDATAMLGDRLDTDVAGAVKERLTSILVMTGVTTAKELETSPIKPDYVFCDLVELKNAWEASKH